MQAFKDFRIYFLRGLAALLPTILTIWIFAQCYIFVRDNISVHINRGLVHLMVYSFEYYPSVTNEQLQRYAIGQDESLRGDIEGLQVRIKEADIIRSVRINEAEKYWVHGTGQIAGFLLALIVVCIVGAILASVVGKTLWRIFEKFLMKTPILRKIYPYIKQVTDFVLTRDKLSFTKVVAVEYPRKGIWSVAMVTGAGLRRVVDTQHKEFLTVFIPSSPAPFTGYVISVPKDETIDLDISIEQALRFTVSGGVITPDSQGQLDEAAGEKKLEPGQN